MKNIERKLEQNLECKKFEDNLMKKLNSNIFESLDEIDFIINRLKEDPKLKNKKITFNLLFKASRDGNYASDFHRKCDGKVQQLFFIKTTKGEIFGGYTEKGYRSRNNFIEDNNAFAFSF